MLTDINSFAQTVHFSQACKPAVSCATSQLPHQ